MFIVCLKPASSQAELALTRLQMRLFAETGAAGLMALPPLSAVVVCDEMPDADVLDGRFDRFPAKRNSTDTQRPTIRVERNAGNVFYLPVPEESLATVWNAVRSRLPSWTGTAAERDLGPFTGIERPSIFLGTMDPETDPPAVDTGELDAAGSIRSYCLSVIQIQTNPERPWWAELRWETLYEREIHHRQRR